jgi:hypothetical protein
MISALLTKIGVPLLIAGGGFFGGMVFQAKVLKPNITVEPAKVVFNHKCPDCNCPPTLGSEIDKIKAKGRANLTIHLHQNYTSGSDSTDLRLIIDQALNQYSLKRKK